MSCNNEITEIKFPDHSNLMESKEIEIMLTKHKSSLCKIKTSQGVSLGFLCKIPSPVLITCNHILEKSESESGNEIIISSICSNTEKISKIDSNRKTYTIEKIGEFKIDMNIIEIFPEKDGLENENFLEIDEYLIEDDDDSKYLLKKNYESKNIYIIHDKD